MRLLDLVEQDHLVGTTANRFRQRAALFIADIAWRSADQARDGMLLHIFRHIETNHRVLVVEQIVGERLGQLGLADAGRSKEQERADGTVRVLQAGARTAHRGRDGLDRLLWPMTRLDSASSIFRSF